GSRNEIERGAIGIAEIATLRLLAFRDALQQRVLNAEFDVADGERAEADAGRAGNRRAVGLDVDTLDAERRHGVDVGRDHEPFRGAQLGSGEDLYPGLPRGHDHLAILQHGAPSCLAAAVGGDEGAAEALLELLGLGRHHAALIMRDERHLGAGLVAMTPTMPPTIPLAPKTATVAPASLAFCALRRRSTQATIAPAVVKAPDGSAKIEVSKGGNIAPFAASIMSSPSSASRPPMKMQVLGASGGARENIASCTRPVTSFKPILV